MNRDVWILDQDEDNRVLAFEGLAHAGLRTLAFSSAERLVAHAVGAPVPLAVVVDATTAAGWERTICRAVASRMIVLTTWPSQLVPWMTLGASRFFLKPYALESLLEHIDRIGSRPSGVFKTLSRRRRRAA